MIQRLATVSLVVKDYDEALEFYITLWDLIEPKKNN